MTRNNVGGVDAVIRAALGSLFMVLAAAIGDAFPFLALGVALVALAILVTAIAGVCPLYTVLGIDTRPGARMRPRIEAKRDLAHHLR